MVALGISEFTFGFAFLHEQVLRNTPIIRAVPMLPSLQQEADAGWDAHLPLAGADFYYQFKMAERLVRANAAQRADNTYHSPYYRICLHHRDHNRQHRLLWDHAQTNPYTYYVSPEFDSFDIFNTAFLNNTVTAFSCLIPLTECGTYPATDNDRHHLTYQENSPTFYQFSERREGKRLFLGENPMSVYQTSASRWRPLDNSFANKLKNETVGKLNFVIEESQTSRLVPDDESLSTRTVRWFERARQRLDQLNSDDVIAVVRECSEVLSVALGITMVIVGTDEMGAIPPRS